MKPAVFFFLGLLLVASCDDNTTQTNPCVSVALMDEVSLLDLISAVPENALTQFIEYPDEHGALGPNKNGYIHARFQTVMTYLVEFAIRNEDEEAIDEFAKSLNYSFSHQTESGDFEFVVPPNAPNNQPPPEQRLANETATYAYGLGVSLLLLEQSEWYQQLAVDHSAKLAITDLGEEINLLLQYLKINIELLKAGDGMSPNRLLHDVIAIYSLGGYLKDEDASNLVLPMLERVFAARNNEGYFQEAGGWDSSYNGVSIKLGLELYVMLSAQEHALLRSDLEEAVTCAANWQVTRILETGEISTAGNSLVYPGGESMGGMEKRVDAEKTIRAFYYMELLAEDESFGDLGTQVLAYYK